MNSFSAAVTSVLSDLFWCEPGKTQEAQKLLEQKWNSRGLFLEQRSIDLFYTISQSNFGLISTEAWVKYFFLISNHKKMTFLFIF